MRKVEKPYHGVTHRSVQHHRLSEKSQCLCGFVSYQPRKRLEEAKSRFSQKFGKLLEKVLESPPLQSVISPEKGEITTPVFGAFFVSVIMKNRSQLLCIFKSHKRLLRIAAVLSYGFQMLIYADCNGTIFSRSSSGSQYSAFASLITYSARAILMFFWRCSYCWIVLSGTQLSSAS